MNRRRLLLGSAGALSLSLAGCSGRDDDAEREDVDSTATGAPGRIDPLGHALPSDSPFYTFGHVSPDGRWGVMGSYPTSESAVASTLVDLEDVGDPIPVHELATSDALTRTNDVKFDALREGLYYRTQEGRQEGLEVVDFGWEDGTPSEPAVVGSLETPNTGVHKLTPHPDEPVCYLVDMDLLSPGIHVVDVSTPDDPVLVDEVGPIGSCHDVEYDPAREVLHAAYIDGQAEGYVIYDASVPDDLTELGGFEYPGQPNYETIGEPGFQSAHQAHPDSERDLVVVGDETSTGIPGGKHVFDIGWDEGSLEDPQPIGFTHSPDAREMTETEQFWWTTHFHDVIHDDGEVLLVDGGFRQGAWVCNITDPREPTPTERYATAAEADRAPDVSDETPGPATPPFAWGAVYHDERDFVFVTDSLTGAYTFDVSVELARGDDDRGPAGHYDLETVLEDGAVATDAGHDH